MFTIITVKNFHNQNNKQQYKFHYNYEHNSSTPIHNDIKIGLIQ